MVIILHHYQQTPPPRTTSPSHKSSAQTNDAKNGENQEMVMTSIPIQPGQSKYEMEDN